MTSQLLTRLAWIAAALTAIMLLWFMDWCIARATLPSFLRDSLGLSAEFVVVGCHGVRFEHGCPIYGFAIANASASATAGPAGPTTLRVYFRRWPPMVLSEDHFASGK